MGKFENNYFNKNVQRFRGGLVFKSHRRCASLNSRLESTKAEKKKGTFAAGVEASEAGPPNHHDDKVDSDQ